MQLPKLDDHTPSGKLYTSGITHRELAAARQKIMQRVQEAAADAEMAEADASRSPTTNRDPELSSRPTSTFSKQSVGSEPQEREPEREEAAKERGAIFGSSKRHSASRRRAAADHSSNFRSILLKSCRDAIPCPSLIIKGIGLLQCPLANRFRIRPWRSVHLKFQRLRRQPQLTFSFLPSHCQCRRSSLY